MIFPLSRTKARSRLLTHAAVILGALFMVYPLVWMLSASFKPMELIFSNTSLWSPEWTLSNYLDGWGALDYAFATFFLNSLIVCLGSILGNLISCSMAAYAFARLRFKGKALWFAIMLGSIMLPYHVL